MAIVKYMNLKRLPTCCRSNCTLKLQKFYSISVKDFLYSSYRISIMKENYLFQQWYVVSKILAEEAARRFAQENDIDLVVINPGLVTGPLLQPTLNETSQCFLTLISKGNA